MVLPVLKTFVVTRGIGFDYRFQWLEGVPGSATPQPLSGYTGNMTITSWDGSTAYLTLVTGASPGNSGLFVGGSTNDPTTGIIDIVIAPNDTAAITWQTARYNLVMTPPSAPGTRLLYGSIGLFGFVP